jgi:cation transport ATPase
MSEQKFCTNCGAPLSGDAAFCSKCGRSVAQVSAGPVPPPPPTYHRNEKYQEKHEKHERGEKHEKHEKHEKGEKMEKGGRAGWVASVFAGIIIIWLGLSIALALTHYITDWWAYFLMGLGVILIIEGFILAMRRSHFYPFIGFFIGGATVFLIGLGDAFKPIYFWSYFLIVIGIVIIAMAIFGRRRAPRP